MAAMMLFLVRRTAFHDPDEIRSHGNRGKRPQPTAAFPAVPTAPTAARAVIPSIPFLSNDLRAFSVDREIPASTVTHPSGEAKVAAQSRGDLLLRPAALEAALDFRAQPRMGEELRRPWAVRASVCRVIGSPRTILRASSARRHFARDRRRRPSQSRRNHTTRLARQEPARNLFAI